MARYDSSAKYDDPCYHYDELPAPADLTATVVAEDEVEVAWKPVAGALGYRLNADQAAFEECRGTPVYAGDQTSFRHTGLKAGASYYYRVQVYHEENP